MQLLLDHGADPNQRDGLGNTPLHLGKCHTDELCVQRGEVKTALLFLSPAPSSFLCITVCFPSCKDLGGTLCISLASLLTKVLGSEFEENQFPSLCQPQGLRDLFQREYSGLSVRLPLAVGLEPMAKSPLGSSKLHA